MTAGSPRTASSAPRKIGTRASVAGCEVERVEIESDPARYEEHGDQEPVADGLDLDVELGMGPRSIAINHPDERPGDECSEDRLETEVRARAR